MKTLSIVILVILLLSAKVSCRSFREGEYGMLSKIIKPCNDTEKLHRLLLGTIDTSLSLDCGLRQLVGGHVSGITLNHDGRR